MFVNIDWVWLLVLGYPMVAVKAWKRTVEWDH